MEIQSRILEQLQQQHFKPNILHIHIKTKNIKLGEFMRHQMEKQGHYIRQVIVQ